MSKGANVRPGKLSKFPKPHKGRTLPVFCTLDENGEAELELTIEVSGDGRFNIGCGAFGNPDPKTKKRPVTWVDCTALTVNDKTEIPGAKIKVIPVARWRLVSRTWKQTDTKTYVIKASFEKVSADRAAKLSAQAKRNAAKSRKK